MWQNKELCFILLVLLLAFPAFCIEAIPKGKSLQFGKFVIGSITTGNETNNGVVKKLHSDHAGDTKGYQSDQLGLTEWTQLAKLRLRRLGPSVQCDNDSMTLHIQGNQVPHFFVETNEKGLVPLSQMPSSCGFSMKRARRDVMLTAKYDGCNVAQQGNAYILPLRVLGVAVEMACPVACPLPTVSCSPTAMVVNLGVSPDAVRLKVNGLWQPLYQAFSCGFTLEVVGGGLTLTAPYTSNCWQFKGAQMFLPVQYMDVELTLSCPAVQTLTDATIVAPASADQQAFPYWLPAMNYPYGYGVPQAYRDPGMPRVIPTTEAPTTPATTVAPLGSYQQALYHWAPVVQYPHVYGVPWNFHYSNPRTPPVFPTTKAPTKTAVPASADQQVLHPGLLGLYPSGKGMPWLFQYGWPGFLKVAPTAPASVVVPSSADELRLYPLLPGKYNPYSSVASPGVYHMPGINTFPKDLTLNRKPGRPVINPSKVVSYPEYSPLQVKGPGK